MKDFFGRKFPSGGDVLIIESGSPHITDRAVIGLHRMFPNSPLHLATCWPNRAGRDFAQVFAVGEYAGRSEKVGLLGSFRRHGYSVLALLCSGEPIMNLWRTLALLLVPAKVIIINENGDFFWLSWENRTMLRSFLSARWGVNLRHGLKIVLLALAFPFTVLFLMLTALYYYLRRWRNLIWWKLTGA
jgi:hypothetical protein